MQGIFINPTPLLSAVHGPHSLSERINISTRSLHTQLNRLILLRLPLALPPQTTNPSKYVSGLLFIVPIYITFESLWQSILDSPCDAEVKDAQRTLKQLWDAGPSSPESRCDHAKSNPHVSHQASVRRGCSRTHCLLSDLQLPGLPRAERLRNDIRVLTGTPEYKLQEQLAAVSQQGKLAEFLAHTKKSVEANPHVLLAYAWVLYMALFSGGRHLRAALEKAGGIGPKFWDREPSPVRPYSITHERSLRHGSKSEPLATENSVRRARSRSRSDSTLSRIHPGMQFFNFPGEEDGEDIKRQFKARYAEAEAHLTECEKEDIISEAQYIFKFMVEMIHELDFVMQTRDEDLENERLLENSRTLVASRNSIAVTHERLSRSRIIDREGLENPRKANHLEFLVNQPMARLVQFKDAFPSWDLVVKPLGRRFSKDGPSQVSFNPSIEEKRRRPLNDLPLFELYFPILVVLLTALMAFSAWYSLVVRAMTI